MQYNLCFDSVTASLYAIWFMFWLSYCISLCNMIYVLTQLLHHSMQYDLCFDSVTASLYAIWFMFWLSSCIALCNMMYVLTQLLHLSMQYDLCFDSVTASLYAIWYRGLSTMELLQSCAKPLAPDITLDSIMTAFICILINVYVGRKKNITEFCWVRPHDHVLFHMVSPHKDHYHWHLNPTC